MRLNGLLRDVVVVVFFVLWFGLRSDVFNNDSIYTASQKTGPQTHDHNSGKSQPIYKNFTLKDSVANLQLSAY